MAYSIMEQAVPQVVESSLAAEESSLAVTEEESSLELATNRSYPYLHYLLLQEVDLEACLGYIKELHHHNFTEVLVPH